MQTHKELLSRTPTVRDSPTETILEMIQVALCYTRVSCTLQRENNMVSFKKNVHTTSSGFRKADKSTTRWHILLGQTCHSVDLDLQQSEYIVATNDDMAKINQLRCQVTECKRVQQKK